MRLGDESPCEGGIVFGSCGNEIEAASALRFHFGSEATLD